MSDVSYPVRRTFRVCPGERFQKLENARKNGEKGSKKNASTIPNRNGQTRSASAAADPFYRYHRFINTFQTFPAPLCPTKPRSHRNPGTGKLSFSRCILAILTLPYGQRVETSVKVKQSKRWRENEETRTLFALLPSSLTGPEHTRNPERLPPNPLSAHYTGGSVEGWGNVGEDPFGHLPVPGLLWPV